MKFLPINLKKIRAKWGLNQEEFGQLFGKNRGTITHYEAGNNNPGVAFMKALSHYTGITIVDLTEREILHEEIPRKPIREETSPPLATVKEPNPEYNANSDPADILKDWMQLIEKRIIALEKSMYKE